MNMLIDAGFLIGLCDCKDQHHRKSVEILNKIQYFRHYIPWPVSYEVLRTKCVKNRYCVLNMKKYFRDMNSEFIDDSPYREAAFQQTLETALKGRSISLVDMILRLILSKEQIKVDSLVTFNIADFQDVCKKKNIQIMM